MPTTCYHGYELPCPYNGCKSCIRKCMGIQLHCASVGGSEQAIAISSHLREAWANCVRSVMLVSRFICFCTTGKAEISADAESFGSPQTVTDDRKTHRDCLIDGQCKPQAVTDQTHWHYITTHPHSVHTVTLITTFCKIVFLLHAHMHHFLCFHMNKSSILAVKGLHVHRSVSLHVHEDY